MFQVEDHRNYSDSQHRHIQDVRLEVEAVEGEVVAGLGSSATSRSLKSRLERNSSVRFRRGFRMFKGLRWRYLGTRVEGCRQVHAWARLHMLSRTVFSRTGKDPQALTQADEVYAFFERQSSCANVVKPLILIWVRRFISHLDSR